MLVFAASSSAAVSLPSIVVAFTAKLPSATGPAFGLVALGQACIAIKDERHLKRVKELLAIHPKPFY